jgi:DNA-binding IclR family transcriptional regulator
MIQSLERGMRALIFLARKNAGVTEVAEELGVNKSTAFRILETLEADNFVLQDEATAKYRLGPGVLRLSGQLVKNLNIISVAKPFMAKLADDTGESAHLCMLSNDSAVVIDQIMASSRLSVNARVGNAEPAHCSSVGKCLLAYCEEDKRERILSRIEFTPYTKNTITDAGALRRELEGIRARGYAVDDGELSEDVLCVAAPVFNHAGAVFYSVGISGPRSRMKGKKVGAVAEMLMQETRKISEQLGHYRE